MTTYLSSIIQYLLTTKLHYILVCQSDNCLGMTETDVVKDRRLIFIICKGAMNTKHKNNNILFQFIHCTVNFEDWKTYAFPDFSCEDF